MLAVSSVAALLVATAHAATLRDSLNDPQNYSFGSGAFGVWTRDDSGGPSYVYTLDQTTDPRATYNSSVDPFQRLPTDHLFELGNDRLVALASNYGYVSVRTDEGGPKLLNDFYPEAGVYGGGVGYLVANTTPTDGTLLLSSFYNHTADPRCASPRFDRQFGVGYLRKMVWGCSVASGAAASVTHDVVVPFGTDPVVVSIVAVTNAGDVTADFEWTETWASAWYHLDLYSRQLQYASGVGGSASAQQQRSRRARGDVGSGSGVSSYLADFRAFVAAHYSPAFARVAGGGGGPPYPGVEGGFAYTGLTGADVAEMARIETALAVEAATNAFVGPMQAEAPPGASIWDAAPPTVTLLDVSQDGEAAGASSDCAAYFGAGGSRAPSGALVRLPAALNATPAIRDSCLLLRRTARSLRPGETATFAFVWTYVTPRAASMGLSAQAIAAKYAVAALDGSLRPATTAAFVNEGYRFSLPRAPPGPWVEREVLWHSYYAHSALTYDDYFNETILDQGTEYRYGNGMQAAARDPLQHILPLLYTRPDAAKSVLRYTLKELQAAGALFTGPPYYLTPWGIVCHGLLIPWGLRPSDLEVYTLLAAAEYILATRDVAFLEEAVTAYNASGGSPGMTVGALLTAAFRYRTAVIGVGEHGLMRVQGSDWSDSFCDKVPGCVFNNSLWWAIYERGESLLVSGQVAYGLQRLAEALQLAGPAYAELAANASSFAATQVAALRQHGTAAGGPWLRRSWLPGLPPPGFQGDTTLEITQQPWAVLAGVFNASFAAALAAAVRTNLSDPSPIGPAIMAVPYPSGGPPGHQENGGVWQGSLNQPWVWALAGINASDAWEQFLLNSLAAEAVVYGGEFWAGVWTSSDAVDSFLSANPGRPSWDNFPVLCTHRHAWPLFALTKLAGVTLGAAGLSLTPAPLPRPLICGEQRTGAGSSGDAGLLWSLETPVVAVHAYANGSWAGRFLPPSSQAALLSSFRAVLPLQVCACDGNGGSGGSLCGLRPGADATVTVGAGPALGSSSSALRASVSLRTPTPAEAAAWATAAPVLLVADFRVALRAEPAAQAASARGTFFWSLEV